MNLPVAVVAVVLSMKVLPAGRRGSGRLDLPGATAFTLSAAPRSPTR